MILRGAKPLQQFTDVYFMNHQTKIADLDGYKKVCNCLLILYLKWLNFENILIKQKGLIYGLELGSILAVKALDLQSDDNVVEMCCSPGAKLLYISDLLEMQNGKG